MTGAVCAFSAEVDSMEIYAWVNPVRRRRTREAVWLTAKTCLLLGNSEDIEKSRSQAGRMALLATCAAFRHKLGGELGIEDSKLAWHAACRNPNSAIFNISSDTIIPPYRIIRNQSYGANMEAHQHCNQIEGCA